MKSSLDLTWCHQHSFSLLLFSDRCVQKSHRKENSINDFCFCLNENEAFFVSLLIGPKTRWRFFLRRNKKKHKSMNRYGRIWPFQRVDDLHVATWKSRRLIRVRVRHIKRTLRLYLKTLRNWFVMPIEWKRITAIIELDNKKKKESISVLHWSIIEFVQLDTASNHLYFSLIRPVHQCCAKINSWSFPNLSTSDRWYAWINQHRMCDYLFRRFDPYFLSRCWKTRVERKTRIIIDNDRDLHSIVCVRKKNSNSITDQYWMSSMTINKRVTRWRKICLDSSLSIKIDPFCNLSIGSVWISFTSINNWSVTNDRNVIKFVAFH